MLAAALRLFPFSLPHIWWLQIAFVIGHVAHMKIRIAFSTGVILVLHLAPSASHVFSTTLPDYKSP